MPGILSSSIITTVVQSTILNVIANLLAQLIDQYKYAYGHKVRACLPSTYIYATKANYVI